MAACAWKNLCKCNGFCSLCFRWYRNLIAIGEHVFALVGATNKFGLVCKNSDPKKMLCLILFAPQSIWLSDHFQTQEYLSRSQFLTRFDRLQLLRRHDRNKSRQVELTEFIGRFGGSWLLCHLNNFRQTNWNNWFATFLLLRSL